MSDQKISIDHIKVSLSDDWQQFEQDKSSLVYGKSNREVFSVHIDHNSAQMPTGFDDLDGTRDHYRLNLGQHANALIQADFVEFCGYDAVYVLGKALQQPAGRGLISSGTLIVPRDGQCLIIKHQAIEVGTTGGREAAIAVIENKFGPDGWSADPYDPSVKLSYMMNLADQEKYDKDFPDHPLSLTRGFMANLEDHVILAEAFAEIPAFHN